MKSTLILDGQEIPFEVVKSRGKRISLGFSSRRPLLQVRTPSGRWGQAEQLTVQQHEAWVLSHYKAKQSVWAKRAALQARMQQGEMLLLGTYRPVIFEATAETWAHIKDTEIRITYRPKDARIPRMHLLYDVLRSYAQQVLPPMVMQEAEQTGLSLQNIRVKDVTTRWGSCSSKRNINLNWHLILLEPRLIRYLIIHELMHLHEMNHSARFWAWVGKYYPNYKEADHTLSSYEWVIGLFDDFWEEEA